MLISVDLSPSPTRCFGDELGGEPHVISDIALLITAMGVIGAVYGLRQSYRERLRQFEAMYVTRYWAIFDRLSLDALRGSNPKTISHADEHAIRAYLRLCEDELEMREAGYIGDGTYALWADGIREQLQQPMFARVWSQVSGEATSPYDHLTGIIKEGESYEPCPLPTWQRRLRGLAGLGGV